VYALFVLTEHFPVSVIINYLANVQAKLIKHVQPNGDISSYGIILYNGWPDCSWGRLHYNNNNQKKRSKNYVNIPKLCFGDLMKKVFFHNTEFPGYIFSSLVFFSIL